MTPLDPPAGPKLDSPVCGLSVPGFQALPNPLPPRPPNPDVAFVAKGDAPPKPEDEPKPPLGLGPEEPNPDPDPELLRLPNGDLAELANAERPDDANAEDDVCCLSFAFCSDSDVCFVGDGDFASAPNGETLEVLAEPEGFST